MGKTVRRGRPPAREPKPGDRVPLGLRVTAKLKRDLDHAAAKTGRSQSQEAELRLERSFAEDEAVGGREMREVANAMTAGFTFVAKRTATALGHPEWSGKDWLTDQGCYRAAALHVCLTLLEGLPNPSREELELTLHALVGRVGASLTRSGQIKWTFDEKEGPVGSGFVEPKDEQQ